MFTDLFYLMRARGLKVSMNEWLSLMDALERGLCRNSLLEFYYVSRAILVKTEADFDKFDEIFLDYFDRIQHIEDIPQELMDWLHDPKNMKKIRQGRGGRPHHLRSGKTPPDAGGAPPGAARAPRRRPILGGHRRHLHHGPLGLRRHGYPGGGKSQHRHALQVAGERDFRDFREDNVLDQRSFQLAFRRLRQMTTRQDGPMDVLNLDRTIDETCNNAGYLQLEFDRPRTNDIKVMVLFDSGGSMTPLRPPVQPALPGGEPGQQLQGPENFLLPQLLVLRALHRPPVRLRGVGADPVGHQQPQPGLQGHCGGGRLHGPLGADLGGGKPYYNRYNAETGLTWLNRFHNRFEKMVWFNPIPEAMWEYDYGYQTIEMIRNTVDMYQLTVEGLGRGLKKLVSAR